jgi:hypothetical protein
MSVEWELAMSSRATLARDVDAGIARFAAPIVCEATTFGGPHDAGTGHGGYKGEDLRRWCYPEPFACAELSTNYDAPIADLDFRAIIMLVPLAQRRELMASRVAGDPPTGLPHRWPFRVSVAGQSVTCAKLDIGRGGKPANVRTPRALDLFWIVAAWLGVENAERVGWRGVVTIEVALFTPVSSG